MLLSTVCAQLTRRWFSGGRWSDQFIAQDCVLDAARLDSIECWQVLDEHRDRICVMQPEAVPVGLVNILKDSLGATSALSVTDILLRVGCTLDNEPS